jgi:hypothetical protein
MSSEIILGVDYYIIIIMMIFNMSNFIFPQIIISLFWGLFTDKTDLTLGYCNLRFLKNQMFSFCHKEELQATQGYINK